MNRGRDLAIWILLSAATAAGAMGPAASAPPPRPEEVIADLSIPGPRNLTTDRLAAYAQAMETAVRLEPSNNRWQFGLALVERFQGKRAEQLERMKRVAEAEPGNSSYQFQLGQAYMASLTPDAGMLATAGRAGDARDAWERAVRIDPDNVYAHYAAAQYYIQARKQGGVLFGSYSKAADHGQALLKVPDRRGEFWGRIVLGQVAAAQEKWDDMAREYTAAESAAGDGADPRTALLLHAAALVNDKRDAAAALPVLARLEARNPDPGDPSLPFLRGMANKILGHCDRAAADFRRILAQNASARNTRLALAECLDQAGDRPGAIANYEEFVRRFPQDDRAGTAEKALKRLRKPGA